MAQQGASRGVSTHTERGAAEAVEVARASCECGRPGCRESLRISLPTFEWARTRGLIVLRPGHEFEDDTVVDRTTEFLLVRARVG